LLIELPGGFILPIEWVLTVFALLIALPVVTAILVLRLRGDKSPIEENMALIVPVDRNGTIQVGQLVGGVQQMEDELIVTNPDWTDEEDNAYTATVPKEKKVPFPFFDIEKHLKKLWIIFDKGNLEVASASEIVNGWPSRYDIPLADRRKLGKFLVGRGVIPSIQNALSTPKGILFIIGVWLFGGMTFMVIAHVIHF